MRERFYKVKDGEWIEPDMALWKLGCCDCGLVHNVTLRVVKGKVQLKAVRNRRSTGQMRRGMKNGTSRRKT